VQSRTVSLGERSMACKLTKLPDVHNIVLVLQNGCLVVVHIQVVRSAEDSHDTWKTSRPSLPVHAVSGILSLVRANNREQVVLFEERASGGIREKVRAASNVVVDEEIIRLLLPELLERVGPEDVAHQAVCGWFAETINLA
jgi:hypothetical protein